MLDKLGSDRLNRKVLCQSIKIFSIILIVVLTIVGVVLSIIFSISGIPTIIVPFILIVLALGYIVFISRVIKEGIQKFRLFSKADKREITRYKVLGIISIILVIIVLSIFSLFMYIGIGGMASIMTGSSTVQQVLEEEAEAKGDDIVNWLLPDKEVVVPPSDKTYGSEADKLVEFALAEAEYYKENKIIGGHRYWDWAKSKKKASGELKAWCACFVSYCVVESGLSGKDKAFGDILNGGKHGGILSCTSWKNYFDAMDIPCHTSADKNYVPKRGDIVIFYRKGGFKHIGIVEKTDANGDVWTIEGNTGGGGSSKSKALHQNRKKMAKSYWYWESTYFYTPNYAQIEVPDADAGTGGGVTGKFSIGSYQRSTSDHYNGYYDPAVMGEILYDFFRLEMGYNNAATCGALANLNSESAGNYDQLEYTNDGWAYGGRVVRDGKKKTVILDRNDKYRVPSSGGLGNYKDIPGIDKTLKVTKSLWYDKKNPADGCVPYGMGMGVVQWSGSRRVAMFEFCTNHGYGSGYGPDALYGQLMFMKSELESNGGKAHSGTHNVLLSTDNTAEGAYKCGRYWAEKYERCNKANDAYNVRGNRAKELFNSGFKDKKPSSKYNPTKVETGSAAGTPATP